MVMMSNRFINNVASKQGGAINWKYKQPVVYNNNIFMNNVAPYGSNISSYPTRLLV